MIDETIFPFELSPFQKKAVHGITEGHNILVTAHTGSGKTVPAEFAIHYFSQKGKKIIYTTPIKALSNQKMHEFTNKFPDLSVGLLTGDCKCNPDADVLIMTTEILRNHLFNSNILDKKNQGPLEFTMDIENELGCVVFDEVHYIADPERGGVWEQAILLLPNHIQMVMLSATIHKPEKFASWVQEKKTLPVDICSTNTRVVPLVHYSYCTAPTSAIEKIQNKDIKNSIENSINRFHILKSGSDFQDVTYNKMKNTLEYFEKQHIRIPRKFVLNSLWNDLKKQEKLPALCFVFSRKQVEVCASEVNFSLFEEHDSTPSIIRYECKQMLVSRFKNWREYTCLPEYENIIKLMEKGVAIHHAGIIPVFREMIELMYDKKYIKLLFATETFAVGLNMPTKCVIFTSLYKYNGNTMRELFSNEYTQMAGRAGRRGIDTIGHVIHCNNLFEPPSCISYRGMLMGEPPILKSKFKINYNLVLSILNSEDFRENQSLHKLIGFVEQSMMQEDILSGITLSQDAVIELEKKRDTQNTLVTNLRTPKNILDDYYLCKYPGEYVNQKKRKEYLRKARRIEEEYKTLKNDYDELLKLHNIDNEIKKEKETGNYAKNFVETNIQHIINILIVGGFINDEWLLQPKGIIATYMHEVHCLAFGELYDKTDGFKDISSCEIAGIFSCFAEIRVSEEIVCYNFKYNNKKVQDIVNSIKNYHDKYYDLEIASEINTGSSYNYQYDIVILVMNWFNANDESECLSIIQNAKNDKDIFLGDFIKALLKINNIVKEMEKVALLLNNIELVEKLKNIEENTLKFVVSNQSLYI